MFKLLPLLVLTVVENIEHFFTWATEFQKMRTVQLTSICETIPAMEILKTQLDVGLSNLL